MQVLSLGDNKFRDGGLSFLAPIINRVKTLNIFDCGIGTSGVIDLAQNIRKLKHRVSSSLFPFNN